MKPTILLLTLATLACLPGLARGDDIFAINWSTIDGGGGTSTSPSGEFSVSGTIGQPDTGATSGGTFSLEGGFWARFGVVQNPGAPLLTIERLPNGDVRVAWPLAATGWVLSESATLGQAPDPWTEVPPANYQTNATHRFILIPNPTGRHFFALRLP